MNLLHGLFRDPAIGNDISYLIPPITIIVVRGFSSESWHFRNACTIIFGTLVQRMLGSKRVRDEKDIVNTVTSREFFNRFVRIF